MTSFLTLSGWAKNEILLDTHILIWWDLTPEKLSATARQRLEDRQDTFVISAASLWEMQIKLAIGKLTLRLPLADLVREQQQNNGFEILPVTLEHVLALKNLAISPQRPV
jgi:PIN domain nuclease of toxin-antitoxin system